ncbi:hypothetical protein Leryth_027140, partial [Lithospermum erythrorhizon]
MFIVFIIFVSFPVHFCDDIYLVFILYIYFVLYFIIIIKITNLIRFRYVFSCQFPEVAYWISR